MKWTRAQLLQNDNFHVDQDLGFSQSDFDRMSGILALENVHLVADGYLNGEETEVLVHLDLEGDMILPDSITNEPLRLPFRTESDEVYSFVPSEEDGVRLVENDVVDLRQAILDAIQLEVPLQVTQAADDEYPEGDGWKVYSEAAYQQSQSEEIDPRLAKLKEFKEQD
ncbi:YceD family protein [Bulleidia extructa]|uniref:YceD family protein n=1 Tax=Bulleidia extructa TaxID=118748 RepID=UPI002354A198|nr:YceD family protein [Bulleidia extructa]